MDEFAAKTVTGPWVIQIVGAPRQIMSVPSFHAANRCANLCVESERAESAFSFAIQLTVSWDT